MNIDHTRQLHEALANVHETVSSMSLSGCDKDDMFELMERVDAGPSSSEFNAASYRC